MWKGVYSQKKEVYGMRVQGLEHRDGDGGFLLLQGSILCSRTLLRLSFPGLLSSLFLSLLGDVAVLDSNLA